MNLPEAGSAEWWKVARRLAERYGWSRDEVRAVPLSELANWLAD
ncbi:hypothetical protein ACPRNU_05395 [Chromobacterium vaccinii]